MSELSENILRQNYTISINQKKGSNKLEGRYFKTSSTSQHLYKLPIEELRLISHLPNIQEQLASGALLQIYMPDLRFQAIIGMEKAEEPYNGTQSLDVIRKASGYDYYRTLIELDTQLQEKKESEMTLHNNIERAPQYKKLYKGENKYE